MAQQRISGIVTDKTMSKPLRGVTIKLKNLQDSTQQKTLSSNNTGYFSIPNLPQGKYTLTTNYIGYKGETLTLKVDAKPLQFSIRLEPIEISIEEVEITGNPMIALKGDTMEFNADHFSTREYAEADELVAQIPGIIIDEEGNVSAHGEPVTRIIVDGKEFFSSDPRIALKTLPAEIIAKIQLIDEKSEQARFAGFDDGKRNKVINIVTKEDKRNGKFGKTIVGKGNADKYTINSSINGFKRDEKYAINLMTNNINETNFAEQGRGGNRRGNANTERGLSDTYAAAANYTNSFLDKKMDFSADYNFRYLKTNTETISEIEYLSSKQANQFRSQNQASTVKLNEHKFNSRIKWNLDSLNRIDFAPNITHSYQATHNKSNHETILGKENPINASNRNTDNARNNLALGGNLTFMHRFLKKGRTFSINVQGNYNTNNAEGLNLALTSYYKNASLSRIDTNNNQSLTNGYGSGFNSRLAFTETIKRNSRLQVNYLFRNTSNYSNRETFEFLAETGQLGDLKDRLSNEFRNDYNYHSAGLSYIYTKKDSLRIQIGANYQHGVRINNRVVPIHLETTANFSSFLPELTAMYHFSKSKSLEINYNTQTNTPSINNLQDFINNHNELRITNGNPELNQEYKHSIKLQFKDINKTSGRSLTTNIGIDVINSKIVNSLIRTDTSLLLFDDIILGAGGEYIVPINADGAYNIRFNNSYGLPIKKLKINLQSNSRLFLNNDLAQINEEFVNSKNYGFGQTIGVNSNFGKQYIIRLSYTLNGRFTNNPIAETSRYSIFNHRLSNTISIELFKHLVVGSNISYLFNGGVAGMPSIKTTIWNTSLGYKLLKKKNAQIAIKGFDLLGNSKNINRIVRESNITNSTSNTLSRYFLMSFTYDLRKFGSK